MLHLEKFDKIIYIAPSKSSFVESDILFLSQKYEVITDFHSWNKKVLVPIYLLKQLFFLLINIRSSKTIIVSFGGYWSLLPAIFGKIFNRPVSIILNGTDCASIPPINYGSLRKFLLKRIIKLSYQLATILLPVSQSLVHVKNTFYTNDKLSLQGYKQFLPSVKTNYQVIHNGFDINFWKKEFDTKKEKNTFLAVFSESQFFLKGGDLILAAAEDFPSCKFHIAGCNKPPNIKNIENINYHGKIDAESLKTLYNKSQYYFQLSIFEGFGCSLAEAMLCECIPIGSSVNIIPEIIGETGFVLKKRNVQELKEIVKSVLLIDNKQGLEKAARIQIIDKYRMGLRIQKLITIIE